MTLIVQLLIVLQRIFVNPPYYYERIHLYGYAMQVISHFAIPPSAILLCTDLHFCMGFSYRYVIHQVLRNSLSVEQTSSKLKHSKIDLTMKQKK